MLRISARPVVFPSKVENNAILSAGLETTDYILIGDFKQEMKMPPSSFNLRVPRATVRLRF
ncbi:hypothetical protein D9611_005906 [Ephemerocybe angulata]|uniref:Uncharacterized protein n=1 Tax=Ephemerocybe angulata TaxID=980116 RepID=A0A8H5FLN8_9AGAR|nr:hypothetical protein D9611_005906 [Tulosesus angulatus]